MFFEAWSDVNDCITFAEALQEQKAGCVSVTHRQNVPSPLRRTTSLYLRKKSSKKKMQ